MIAGCEGYSEDEKAEVLAEIEKDAERDDFSCCCCGAGLLDSMRMCCPPCEAADCGESDVGTPCRAEAKR